MKASDDGEQRAEAASFLEGEPGLDGAVWKALADPTRRRLLDLLRRGPLPTGKLAERFETTRFAVAKHLRVLVQAGLVLVEERGRERWNHLNPAPIQGISRRWIRSFEVEDADRLLRLKERVETDPDTTMTTTETPLATRTILLEVPIEAPIERVWRALVVDTASWWHRDFFTSAAPKGFHIEPRLGGHMFEDWGEGAGQIWGHVEGVQSPSYLQVVGDTAKDWGGPSRNHMSWRLSEDGGTTLVRFEHTLFGHITAETEASLESGWRQLFVDCLKAYAETGKAPEGSLAAGS